VRKKAARRLDGGEPGMALDFVHDARGLWAHHPSFTLPGIIDPKFEKASLIDCFIGTHVPYRELPGRTSSRHVSSTEVDSGSRRTFYIDERELISNRLSSVCVSYARNHGVPFVPYPYLQPLGRIRILWASIRKPVEANRYKLPKFVSLAGFRVPPSTMPFTFTISARARERVGRDECSSGSMGDGNIRNQELRPLGDLALEEYKKGNYVIVGGDWNSVLAALHIDQFQPRRSQRSF
jgi:hypothetical protein